MKTKGYLKLLREDLEMERKLTDPQCRLFTLILRLADWDNRHDTFARAELIIRPTVEQYLPRWSAAKFYLVLKELLAFGLISKVGRSSYKVEGFERYVTKLYMVKQNGEPTKHNVQAIEQGRAEKNLEKLNNLKQSYHSNNNLFN